MPRHLRERLRRPAGTLLPRRLAVGSRRPFISEEGGARHRTRRPETGREVSASVRPRPGHLLVRKFCPTLLAPLVFGGKRGRPRVHGPRLPRGCVRGAAAVYPGPGDLAVERPRPRLFLSKPGGPHLLQYTTYSSTNKNKTSSDKGIKT